MFLYWCFATPVNWISSNDVDWQEMKGLVQTNDHRSLQEHIKNVVYFCLELHIWENIDLPIAEFICIYA